MNKFFTNSAPESPSSSTPEQNYDDSALEGVAANVKLLLKLIQDHKDACKKEKKDGRRMLRVATMVTILDNVRTRIQKCQSFGCKNSESDHMRRSYTDLKHLPARGDKRAASCHQELNAVGGDDENVRLRKELNASVAARKSLEVMCSSLGKEKEIMVGELSRKAHELNDMEELINDLKAQNRTLLDKVHECASEHKDQDKPMKGSSEGDSQKNSALQERNRTLSEQLQRAMDGYRSMKRKLKGVQEENAAMHETMEEMGAKVSTGLHRIRRFKEKSSMEGNTSPSPSSSVDLRDEIVELEHMFKCFEMQVSKHDTQVKGDCVKPKGEIINAHKPSVLA